jgi:hypothetical protein
MQLLFTLKVLPLEANSTSRVRNPDNIKLVSEFLLTQLYEFHESVFLFFVEESSTGSVIQIPYSID